MKFKDKKLLELAKFWIEDWKKESPTLEDPKKMRLWDNALIDANRKSSEMEMLQALHEFRDEDYIESIWAIRESFFDAFANSLIEEVKELRTSVEVLLKEHEIDPARITIGQLNRLKGGIR